MLLSHGKTTSRMYATSPVASSLFALRAKTLPAARVTAGVAPALLSRFQHDKDLVTAVAEAHVVVDQLIKTHGALVIILIPKSHE